MENNIHHHNQSPYTPEMNHTQIQDNLTSSFKAAAFSITQLYKESIQMNKKSYETGYENGVKDIKKWLESLKSQQNQPFVSLDYLVGVLNGKLKDLNHGKEEWGCSVQNSPSSGDVHRGMDLNMYASSPPPGGDRETATPTNPSGEHHLKRGSPACLGSLSVVPPAFGQNMDYSFLFEPATKKPRLRKDD